MIATEHIARRVEDAIRASADVPAALSAAADALYRARSYLWVGIYAIEGTEVVRRATRGPVNASASFMLGEGYVGNVARHGRPIVINDVREDRGYKMRLRETRAELVAPIYWDDRVVGVIDVESDEVDAFGDEDLALIERVAALLGPVLAAA